MESSDQQLEYLRQHYDELLDHTELLAEQSALLIRIARHTQLFYVLAWIYVGLTALAIVVFMVAAAASPY